MSRRVARQLSSSNELSAQSPAEKTWFPNRAVLYSGLLGILRSAAMAGHVDAGSGGMSIIPFLGPT
jgi:hypothetical protein